MNDSHHTDTKYSTSPLRCEVQALRTRVISAVLMTTSADPVITLSTLVEGRAPTIATLSPEAAEQLGQSLLDYAKSVRQDRVATRWSKQEISEIKKLAAQARARGFRIVGNDEANQ